MTGWRLGWMVVPDAMVPVVERWPRTCSSAPAVSQHAALACFEPESIAEYERRRAEFKARRDYFAPAQSLGLSVPVMPDGAFYAWADCSQLAHKLGVAPGQLQLGLCPCAAAASPYRTPRAATSARPTPHATSAFPRPTPWPSCRKPWPAWNACWAEHARDGLSLSLRIYWEDTDAGGTCLRQLPEFFERGRTEWLRAWASSSKAAEQTGGIFVVTHAAVDYVAPARLDDQLWSRPAAIGRPRLLTIAQQALLQHTMSSDGQLSC
jgi:YbgC/YbaW family acyl-CoA thioester hydrolase